jgi:hypothetical protein
MSKHGHNPDPELENFEHEPRPRRHDKAVELATRRTEKLFEDFEEAVCFFGGSDAITSETGRLALRRLRYLIESAIYEALRFGESD